MIVIVKECTKCKNHLCLDCFHNTKKKKAKFGKIGKCKSCVSTIAQKNYEENKKEYLTKRKIWKKENKEKVNANTRKWHRENRDKVNLARRNLRNNSSLVKLKDNIRRRINLAITNKSKSSIEYLECEIEQYKEYLEKQFVNGMAWENYGEWHIDHIVPLASAQTKEELEKLFHYTNTQPLWGKDNCRKGTRL